MPWVLFLLVGLVFPLATSANHELLQTIGPGVIWVSVLLAQLLSQSLLFQDDYDAGVVDQWFLQRDVFTQLVAGKMFSHWVMTIAPMIVLSPLLCVMYNLPIFTIKIILLSLLLGTPCFLIQGAIVSALSISLRAEGLLLAIILLPLYIPTLIFGASIVSAAQGGLSIASALELLAALSLAAISVGPAVTAFALKIGIQYS